MSEFFQIALPFIVRSNQRAGSSRSVFDIETDGLHPTKVHCIVSTDLDSDAIFEYGPNQIAEALEHLDRAEILIGHNVNGYDLPVLRRLCDWAPGCNTKIIDTLIASRTILPNLSNLDDKNVDLKLGKLRGSHALEAWGMRLGIPKIGADIEDYSIWTPELQARCVSDVAICKSLMQLLQPDGYSQQALDLEHRVAEICEQITAAGIPFDLEKAEHLRQQWEARCDELAAPLSKQFPKLNPKSRKQLGVLFESCGWVPEERTPKNKQPKIDDAALKTVSLLAFCQSKQLDCD